jgi:hypothetical protein
MENTITLTPARFVTVKLAATLTGLTEKAIDRKRERRIWLEGKHWRKVDGNVLIDMKEYERWADKGQA